MKRQIIEVAQTGRFLVWIGRSRFPAHGPKVQTVIFAHEGVRETCQLSTVALDAPQRRVAYVRAVVFQRPKDHSKSSEPNAVLLYTAKEASRHHSLPCSPVGVRLALVVVHEGNGRGFHVGVGFFPDVLAFLVEEEVFGLESAGGIAAEAAAEAAEMATEKGWVSLTSQKSQIVQPPRLKGA